MKSPFTLRRYFIAAGCTALLAVPVSVILWFSDKQPAGSWPVVILLPLFVGITLPFNIFVLGEIAFRGRVYAIRRHTLRGRQIGRIITGLLLMLLAKPVCSLPPISDWLWDCGESIFETILLIGLLLSIFSFGEFTTQLKPDNSTN
jgi:hypothetical protein